MPNPFTFIYTGFSGVDTSSGIESLGPVPNKPGKYALSVIENGRTTQDGGVFTRKGLEEVADLGSSRVDNIEGVETNAWQIMLAKSGTSIYQSKDPDSGTFYDIGVTRTAGETDFFFPKRKDIFAINRTDSFLKITGSVIASISVAGSTLNLRTGDGDDFDATGEIYVRGIAVTYTGKTTDQLTGCTGLTAAMVAADIVTQTTAYASNPKATCMGELEGSALVGGVSADATALDWSEPSTAAEPELFYVFPATYAIPMPRDITAIKSGNDATLIGMKKGVNSTSRFDVTVGVPLIDSVSVVHSISNAYCIDQMDDDFVVLTQEGRILPAGQTDAGFKITDDPKEPRNDMDYHVQGFLQGNADTTDGDDNFVSYNSATHTAVASIKVKEGFNKEMVLQRNIGAWAIDTGKSVACRTVFKGKTYSGAERGGKIYLDDESTTDNGIGIDYRIVTGLMTVDERRTQFDVLNLVIGGLLSAIGEFTIRIFADGGLIYTQDVTADELIEKGLMVLETGIPIGYGNTGSEPIGTAGEFVEGFGFTFPLELSIECHTFQVEVQASEDSTTIETREMRIDCETEGSIQLNTF